jgi:hypothetical protein
MAVTSLKNPDAAPDGCCEQGLSLPISECDGARFLPTNITSHRQLSVRGRRASRPKAIC